MLKTLNNILETFLGFLVVFIAVVFAGYIYFSGQGSTSFKGYPLIAKFENIDGLNKGSDIKLSGVKIGYVGGVTIDPVTYQAQLSLIIMDSVKIPTDSSAEIASEGLMGGKYVAIIPGGDETVLSSKGVIAETQSSVSLEGLLSKFLFSKGGDSTAKASTEGGHKQTSKSDHKAAIAHNHDSHKQGAHKTAGTKEDGADHQADEHSDTVSVHHDNADEESTDESVDEHDPTVAAEDHSAESGKIVKTEKLGAEKRLKKSTENSNKKTHKKTKKTSSSADNA